MKEKNVGNQLLSIQQGYHPYCSAYFDGCHFWATTPTHASPSYSIYRDSTLIHSITAVNNAAQDSYGVLKPLMRVISGVLYIVTPWYTVADGYEIDMQRYTDATTSTAFTLGLAFGTYYANPIYIFVYGTKYVIPCVTLWSDAKWYIALQYYNSDTSEGSYNPWIDIDAFDVQSARGGYDNGTGTFYYVVSRDGETYLDSHVVYGGTSVGIQVYKISDDTLISADLDDFQWLYKHNDTWFFFDNNGGDVYRGKVDIANSFSKIIAGTSCKYGMKLHGSKDYKPYNYGKVDWGTFKDPKLDDWDDQSATDCIISIIEEVGNEKNVMELDDQSATDDCDIRYDFSNQSNGSIEIWFRSTNTGNTHYIVLYETIANVKFTFRINSDNFQYYKQSITNYITLTTLVDNTWYHLKIVFDCATDTLEAWLDETLLDDGGTTDLPFRFTATNLDLIRFQTYSTHTGYKFYIHSFGFSWEKASNNEIGVVQWGTVDDPDLSDWTDNGADTFEIIAEKEGHRNLLHVIMDATIDIYIDNVANISNTTSFWFMIGQTNKQLILYPFSLDSNGGYIVRVHFNADGNIDFEGTANDADIQAYNANQLYHIKVISVKDGNSYLYLDGVLISTVTGKTDTQDRFRIYSGSADTEFWIDGIGDANAGFDGEIYDNYVQNELRGIIKLDGTTMQAYEVFYGGGVEKLPHILTSIDNISACSNYGFQYLIGAVWFTREPFFFNYTPTRNELLKMAVFESPTYTIQTTEGTYQTSLILADNYYNMVFAGHVIDDKDSTKLPIKTLIFGSNIAGDLTKRHTEDFSAETDGAMLESITDSICVQLTIENGDITSAGSYDHPMNAESIEEFLRWLFARTQKLPRWNGIGEIVFNAPSVDSGLAIIEDNIISEFYIQQETGKYGMVILEAPGIRVQSVIEDGGDGIYYDFYPNVDNETELQSMADNIATMQHNQFEKIQVAVSDTGLLNLAEYASVVYAPNERISVNGNYYIMAFEYIPFADSSLIKLSNAIFVESIMDKGPLARETKINTQRSTQNTKLSKFERQATDPADPPNNTAVLWIDSVGDLKVKITYGDVTKTATLADFSAL